MGRPLNKRYFGADANNNLKVQFNNGTASVPGFILNQLGSGRFKCQDKAGNVAVCNLADKASADLTVGEMSITVVYDSGTVGRITKIAAHKVTINGTSIPWSFDPSTTDNRVQIEEAGTDTVLTSAVDLEGDDGPTLPPGMDLNEPLPGTGSPVTGAVGLSGVTAAARGTPAAPGSDIGSVTTPAAGLYRTKYVGNWLPAVGAAATTWNMDFFTNSDRTNTLGSDIDTTVSYGLRSDLPDESNYSFEWKGYLLAPVSDIFNFFLDSDDDSVMWIGAAALAPTKTNFTVRSTGPRAENAKSSTLVAGKYYPVRFWFSEFGGSEQMQVFANRLGAATKYNGSDLTWAHNSVTKGF